MQQIYRLIHIQGIKNKMDIIINGGEELNGSVDINGAKNAVLPLLAACILTDVNVLLKNIALIEDCTDKIELLEYLGTRVQYVGNRSALINTKDMHYNCTITTRIRTSILLMSVLLGRFKKCIVPSPQGDKIGARNIDMHLDALRKMGSYIEVIDGFIHAETKQLNGIDYTLRFPSVGATQNIILAASMANGVTVLNNAAIEPEIKSLCLFLQLLGIKMEGIGSQRIVIYGSNHKIYHPDDQIDFYVIPDRIQAITYLLLPLITGGQITIKCPNIIESLGRNLQYLVDIGCSINCTKDSLTAINDKNNNIDHCHLATGVFPELFTDIQPQFVTTMCINANKGSMIENLYNGRFNYIRELNKMGAHIEIQGNKIIFDKIPNFTPHNNIMAKDIRSGAAVVMAALNANGKTRIVNQYQIERGYDNFFNKLSNLGANIELVME